MKIDEVVGKLVTRKHQKRLLLVTSILWMIGAAGVMVMPFAIPDISKEWALSTTLSSSLISSVFLGMLVGALSSGLVLDYVGRKVGTIIYLLISVIFTVFFGISISYNTAMFLRFLSGVGYGGLLPAVNTYLSEYTSIKLRGRYLVLLEASWAIGSILIALFAVTIGEKLGWRWNFYIFILGIFSLIPLSFERETPKYIFKKYGKKKLEEIFGRVKGEIEPIEEVKITYKALFSKSHIKKTIVVIVSWFVVSFVYYALFSWAPKIFVAQLGITITKAKWFTFYIYLAQLPGYLSVAYLIEKWGRKPTLTTYFIAMGLSALLLPFVSGNISFLIIMLIISFFTLGVWGLVYAYTPELFPTSFRGTANGLAGSIARIAGIIAPYFTGYFVDKSIFIALLIIAILAGVSGITVLLLGKETKEMSVN
ncbi:MFS transporter [Thermosipho atlanticus]|uniref:MFS transporter, putative metabolite:H+ symporter n=1 Tax=Thermosipho atlanticus DSM 15807 TaxID=1123380 RepID=A0A1M5S3A4_9BACT|nr:MFS transporter [Thermosipho atlanticus]SHH32936.1 MFS transporter, putative metabolite:H+ symporter [Thermosipho atlanticus DSM 15807]